MRNRLIAGLFTAAVLLFTAPVAAEEYIPSHRSSISSDVEVIQGMIQRSQERQGVVQTTQELESEPIAPPVSSQIVETEPVIEAISEPIKSSTKVATVTEQLAPVAVNQSAVSANTPESVQPTTQTPAPDKSTFYNYSTQVNKPSTTPVTATVSANSVLSAETQTPPQSKVVSQSSQQIAVRHIGIQRQQREASDPEPSREAQISNRAFMLFAADLAWERVDKKEDYGLGARLERGVITPLAAIKAYVPEKLPQALAILSGQQDYT
jgi:hypothetical protein